MIRSYQELNIESVAAMPFDDPAQALRLVQGLSGNGVSDEAFARLLTPLMPAVASSADPSRALRNFADFVEHAGSRSMYYDILSTHEALLDALLTLLAASQFLSDLLIKNPEYLEILANPTIRDRKRDMADFLADARRRIAVAKTPGMRRDALRRFKPPEVLRIGARDILGYASTTETVAEISDFAEACVRAATEIVDIGSGFAVIGMGKLGGHELNYASDIDLIFVHDDAMPQSDANKLGEALRDVLAETTPAGFVFRVDLRLRPEGRFGPISRSLSSCRAYYESWAESWERQALLKARVVGGDQVVGAEFLRIAEGFVFQKGIAEKFVSDIQNNKRMIERQTARHGEAKTNVKQGEGGIRDIEFAVQLLQLLAGGAHEELRSGNTLVALDRLADSGLISEAEKSALSKSYVFLRNVEHRLQLLDERPVRNIPIADRRELDKFGRRLGYVDGEAFLSDYVGHTTKVHILFNEIFYGNEAVATATPSQAQDDEIAQWLFTIDDPSSQDALTSHLRNLGFADPSAALEIIKRSEKGTRYGEMTPAARETFAALASGLLDAASASGDPDEALRGLDSLALAAPSRAALYSSLATEPEFLHRLAILAGQAPHLWQMLLTHLEYLDILSDDGELEAPVGPAPILPDLPSTADLAPHIAGYVRRERLRIGARDLWSIASTEQVMGDISDVAAGACAAALTIPGYEDVASQLAIVGLGKLGGKELGYGSDLDMLWVREECADLARTTQLATALMSLMNEGMNAYGVRWETDSRLRPDGRVGTLVRTVPEFEAYFQGGGADAWEVQALIKTRFIAGCQSAGHEFEIMARRIVYAVPINDEQTDAMRHMKRRIENERCKDKRDLKLGPGGLSDIEWTVQFLQWRHGARWRRAQTPSTVSALLALRDAGMIRQDDWEVLAGAYTALTSLRNHIWLRDGRGNDVPSEQPPALIDQRARVREVFERVFVRG